MASEYTTNYQLDLYVGTDRPNLTDQYNSAMRKLDSVIYTQTGQGSAALQVANQAQATANEALSQVEGAATTANSALIAANNASDAVVSESATRANADSDLAEDIVTERNARIAADAELRQLIGDDTAKDYIGIIGDSFSVPGNTIWPTYFQQQTGLNVINKAMNGCGFLRAVNGVTFSTQFDQLMADENWSKVGTIIVYGGVNDFLQINPSYTDEANAIITFMNKYANLPNPKPRIILAFGNCGYARQQTYNLFGTWYERVLNMLKAANVPGVVDYVGMWLFNNTAWMSDNLHPTANGQKLIAEKMLALYNGTYTGVRWVARKSAIGTGNTTAQLTFDNGLITYFTYVQNATIPFDREVTVADFSEYTYDFGINNSASLNEAMGHVDFLIPGNGGYEQVVTRFDVRNGILGVHRYGTNVQGSGPLSLQVTDFAMGLS